MPMSVRDNPHPGTTVAIGRIASHCGHGVIDDVRHGRLSIRAADTLTHFIECGTLKTGEVAALVPYGFAVRTSRGHVMAIRATLLVLVRKGLLVEDRSAKISSWKATPAATQ